MRGKAASNSESKTPSAANCAKPRKACACEKELPGQKRQNLATNRKRRVIWVAEKCRDVIARAGHDQRHGPRAGRYPRSRTGCLAVSRAGRSEPDGVARARDVHPRLGGDAGPAPGRRHRLGRLRPPPHQGCAAATRRLLLLLLRRRRRRGREDRSQRRKTERRREGAKGREGGGWEREERGWRWEDKEKGEQEREDERIWKGEGSNLGSGKGVESDRASKREMERRVRERERESG